MTIDDEPVTGPDPRRIFVFQERGVFPWLTVEEKRARREVRPDEIGLGEKEGVSA